MNINNLKFAGISFFILGCSSWFFVTGEPLTTVAGLFAGVGFGMFLIGVGLAVSRKRN